MEYAATTKNMRQIGKEIGAGYILEGSGQARGNHVRINAQFIDAATDENTWADTFDHELTAENLFDIQAQLAQSIARELRITLSESDQSLINEIPTKYIEAYKAYLRGLEQRDRGGHNENNNVLVAAAFKQAVELDPQFAFAWVQLSIERSRQSQGTNDQSIRDAAKKAQKKAYDLQPDLSEAELANAVYLYRAEFEYQQALDVLEVLQNKHSLDALQLVLKAYLLRRVGRAQEAYQTALKAQKLDPRNIQTAVA